MINKKHILRITIFLVNPFFFQAINAQQNYLPGYVVTLQGDTLNGFINYRNWDKNPNKITYKKSLQKDGISYRTQDIQRFKVKNEEYISAEVEIEISPYKEGQLEYNSDFQLKKKLVFYKH